MKILTLTSSIKTKHPLYGTILLIIVNEECVAVVDCEYNEQEGSDIAVMLYFNTWDHRYVEVNGYVLDYKNNTEWIKRHG